LRPDPIRDVYEPKEEKEVIYPTTFRISEKTGQFDDPFQQAEYAYGLIEAEVQDK